MAPPRLVARTRHVSHATGAVTSKAPAMSVHSSMSRSTCAAIQRTAPAAAGTVTLSSILEGSDSTMAAMTVATMGAITMYDSGGISRIDGATHRDKATDPSEPAAMNAKSPFHDLSRFHGR